MKRLALDELPRSLILKWLLMAVIAGSINAGGFLACARFVTHVTGFATLFGIDLAEGLWQEALGILSVPFWFLIGVMVSAWLTDRPLVKGRPPRYVAAMGLVSAALFGAAFGGYYDLFGLFGTAFQLQTDYALLVLLCFASGVLNAVITTATGGIVRCSHLTGITTDLGIGVMRSAYAPMLTGERRRELHRSALRVAIIASYCGGGAVGAWLFMRLHYMGFVAPALLALYVGNVGMRLPTAAPVAAALLAALLAPPADAKPYPGPLGVPWGKSPADAKSILQTRLTFVEEKPGEEGPYDTIDQRWTGEFAKMKTAELLLRFYKGEFFYLTVTLGTVDAGSASAVFESVVRRMKRAYGKPVVHQAAPKLSSKKSILDNVPLENRGWVLPMLWNEAKKGDAKDPAQDGALKDLMIRINLWDPFAAWSFSNRVKVQTFVFQYRAEGSDPKLPATLKPMWIFAKDDKFKEWKKAVRTSKVVEPRDY